MRTYPLLVAAIAAFCTTACAHKQVDMLSASPPAIEMPLPPPPPPPASPPPSATSGDPVGGRAPASIDGVDAAANGWLVPVAFATDRAPTRRTDGRAAFSGRRGTLVYGEATVSIPRTHEAGEIELPRWYKLEFRPDADKHFVITSAAPLSLDAWSTALRRRLQGSTRKSIFLFVHGYNVDFDQALMRTAQIEHDTAFPGPALLFSWPSTGTETGYAVDGENAAWAVPDLIRVIEQASAATGADDIFMIAHSMGNRVLVAALAELGRSQPALRGKIREVILAAPDIDAAIFKRDIAPRLADIGARVTLYASSRDVALALSGRLHGYGRLGDTRPSVTIAPPIETIDASALSADLLGHSYIGASTTVLGDVRRIFETHAPPAARGLLPMGSDTDRYWRFGAP